MYREKLRHGNVGSTHLDKGDKLTATLPSPGQVQGGPGGDEGARLGQLGMQRRPGLLRLSSWGASVPANF